MLNRSAKSLLHFLKIHSPHPVTFSRSPLSPSSSPDVASDNVSGTLSSPSCRNQDDFDMFAQTRSSSLAEQRKK